MVKTIKSFVIIFICMAAFSSIAQAKKNRGELARQVVREAACVDCFADVPTRADCEGYEDFLQDFYCDEAQTIVNPFEVLFANAATRVEEQLPLHCRLYLMKEGFEQQERIIRDQQLSGNDRRKEREVIELGGSLHFLARSKKLDWGLFDSLTSDLLELPAPRRDPFVVESQHASQPSTAGQIDQCQISSALSQVAQEVSEVLGREMWDYVISENKRSSLSNQYCQIANPLCRAVGGRMIKFNGKNVCRKGMMILDKSCMELPTQKRKIFIKSFNNVTETGAKCLFNDFNAGSFATDTTMNAAQALSLFFNSDDEEAGRHNLVDTQVCCGDRGCLNPALSGKRCQNADCSKRAKTKYQNPEPPPGIAASARYDGYLEFYDHAFETSDRAASEVMFHEFLHKVGAPLSPFHNYPYGIRVINGKCPRTVDGIRISLQNGKCLPVNNACATTILNGPPLLYDPVYSCARSCFPNPMMEAQELDRSRDICRQFIQGNFREAIVPPCQLTNSH